MAALLPLFGFAVIWLNVSISCPKGWRRSFISASLIWGSVVTALTELLSLVQELTSEHVALAWAAVFVAAGGVSVRHSVAARPWQRSFVRPSFPWRDAGTVLLGVGLLCIVRVTGIIALDKVPANYDSMTYHLSRTVHWQQNQSVAHYPTHNLRQLYQNPWAEFAMLHFRLLSGDDTLAQGVQWFSMIGSLIGVSLIVERLKRTSRAALLSAVVAATVPMGVLQASSTQNDYVVTFWLVCAAYSILTAMDAGPVPLPDAAAIGVASGLAILTKGTAYVFLLPFLGWFGLNRMRVLPLRSLLSVFAVIAGAVVLLNLGHWLRNYDLFGSPLGLSAGGGAEMGEEDLSAYGNEAFGPAYLVSNIVRNLAIHAGTSSPQITQALFNGVASLHRWLGVDLSDPRTTWKGKEFAIPRLAFDEDHTGNPVHVLLISWASAAILLNGRARRHDRRLVAYTLACLAAFVLFCGVFKWQPWHSRLQLPWFVLSAPVVGLVLAQVRSRRRRLVDTSALLLIATALLWAYYGTHDYRQAREYPRGWQYFASQPEWGVPYVHAADTLADTGCTDIGFYASSDAWEYPLWTLLHETGRFPVRIEHVNVQNVSQRQQSTPFDPCAVIVIARPVSHKLVVESKTFIQQGAWDIVSVWVPETMTIYSTP